MLVLSVLLAGAEPLASGRRVKGLRAATARRAALDAVAASGTIVRREGRQGATPDACRVSYLGLPALACGPACDGRGLPRPEAGADAGPAAPQAPP